MDWNVAVAVNLNPISAGKILPVHMGTKSPFRNMKY